MLDVFIFYIIAYNIFLENTCQTVPRAGRTLLNRSDNIPALIKLLFGEREADRKQAKPPTILNFI